MGRKSYQRPRRFDFDYLHLRKLLEDLESVLADVVTAGDRVRIQTLASNLPRVWHDPRTPMRERKRMLRLLIRGRDAGA